MVHMEDLNAVLRDLGHVLTKEQLEKLISEADEDGSGTLDIEEFMVLTTRLDAGIFMNKPCERAELPDARVVKFQEVFNRFKKRAEGEEDDTSIDLRDFALVVRALGHSMTQAELDDMVREVDEDGSGTLDYEEFMQLASRLEKNEVQVEQPKANVTTLLDEVYSRFKQGDEGTIPIGSLALVASALGHELTPLEVEEFAKEFDEDGGGSLDYEEYACLASRLEQRSSKDVADLKKVFSRFERTGGFVHVDDLVSVVQELGHKLSETQFQEMIREVDEDGSGTLEFEEFLLLAKWLDARSAPAPAVEEKSQICKKSEPEVVCLSSTECVKADNRHLLQDLPPGRPGAAEPPKGVRLPDLIDKDTSDEPMARISRCRRELKAVMRDIDSRNPLVKGEKSSKNHKKRS